MNRKDLGNYIIEIRYGIYKNMLSGALYNWNTFAATTWTKKKNVFMHIGVGLYSYSIMLLS